MMEEVWRKGLCLQRDKNRPTIIGHKKRSLEVTQGSQTRKSRDPLLHEEWGELGGGVRGCVRQRERERKRETQRERERE